MTARQMLRLIDSVVPGRDIRHDSDWQENADLYLAFIAEHGRAPDRHDRAVADLPGWAATQRPEQVSNRQLRQLEQMHHFTFGLDDAPALLGELAAFDIDGAQPTVAALATEPSELAREIAAQPWAARYLVWLTFCVRYGTQPRVGEPGYGFIRAMRATTPADRAVPAFDVVADWREPAAASLAFRRAAHRWERWTAQHDGLPSTSSPQKRERSIASWRSKTLRRHQDGRLSADELRIAREARLIAAAP